MSTSRLRPPFLAITFGLVSASCGSCQPRAQEPPGGGNVPGSCSCVDQPLPAARDPVFLAIRTGTNVPTKPNPPAGTIPVQAVDLDDDGWMDLTTHQRVAIGDKSLSLQFTPLALYGALPASDNFHGVVAVDLDNDGLNDLVLAPYCTSNNGNQQILFFRNRGKGNFEQASPTLPTLDCANSETIAAADVDGDGLVDLFVPFYPESGPKRGWLLMNRSRGGVLAFSEKGIDRGVACDPSNCPSPNRDPEGAQFIDLDVDGDVDLAVHGRLFFNDGTGHFAEQLAFTDVGIDIDNDKDEGLTFIDYDGDGNLDLYQRVRTNALLLWQRQRVPGTFDPVALQNGNLAFSATSVSTGIEAIMKANGPAYAWGDAWGDFNGDGWPDLVFQTRGAAPLVLVNHHGKFKLDAGCTQADCAGLAAGDGLAVGDFNDDGRPDLYSCTTHGDLFLNVTGRVPGLQPLAISPRDRGGRRNQYGATVQVRDLCDPTYRPRFAVGAWGTYLALNQYDAEIGTVEGHCYSIDVQFARGPEGPGPRVSNVLYDPKREGGRRIVIRRQGETDPREPLGP